MKLKKTNRNWILFAALYVSVIVCIFGSIFGTYAWYQYSSRAGVSYSGTAVGDSDGMQVGLISDHAIAGFAEQFELKEDSESLANKVIYWVSSDGIPSDVITEFETQLGYASNNIGPSSSGSYEANDELKLKSAPSALERQEFNEADKKRYSYIPLAFKVGGKGASNNIYLTGSDVECEFDISQAVRIGFENPIESGSTFIYNPTSYNNGKTAVGGILNLDGDMYYDHKNGKEYIYGEVESSTYNDSAYPGDIDIPEEEITTFTANHKGGVFGASITPKYAHYLGVDNVLSVKPITYSDASNGVAQVNMTVYLEGWDLSCVNAQIDNSYSLNLKFGFGPRG